MGKIHLKRNQIVNASDIDSMIGTQNWTMGNGDLRPTSDKVILRWIAGMYNGRPIYKYAKVTYQLSDLSKVITRDNIQKVGIKDIYVQNLTIVFLSLNDIQTYTAIPFKEFERIPQQKVVFVDDKYYYLKIGKIKLFLNKLFN